jgi:uncharacterized protein involved in exopolysaccharide biosynthesis
MTVETQSPVQAERDPVAVGVGIAFELLRRYWLLFLAVVVLCTGVAIWQAITAVPRYKATIVLSPVSSDRSLGGLSSAIGQLSSLTSGGGLGSLGKDAATEEALAVLRSRRFTEEFIRERNLLPKLLPIAVDEPTAHHYFRASRGFGKQVRTIVQDRKTGLVLLSIEWPDPAEGADIANGLVAKLNGEMRVRAISTANANILFLEQELAGNPTISARDAINRLIEIQIRQRMLASVTKEYAFRVVDPAIPADPADRSYPNKRKIALMGVLAGIVLGAIVVAVVGIVRHRLSLARS